MSTIYSRKLCRKSYEISQKCCIQSHDCRSHKNFCRAELSQLQLSATGVSHELSQSQHSKLTFTEFVVELCANYHCDYCRCSFGDTLAACDKFSCDATTHDMWHNLCDYCRRDFNLINAQTWPKGNLENAGRFKRREQTTFSSRCGCKVRSNDITQNFARCNTTSLWRQQILYMYNR